MQHLRAATHMHPTAPRYSGCKTTVQHGPDNNDGEFTNTTKPDMSAQNVWQSYRIKLHEPGMRENILPPGWILLMTLNLLVILTRLLMTLNPPVILMTLG